MKKVGGAPQPTPPADPCSPPFQWPSLDLWSFQLPISISVSIVTLQLVFGPKSTAAAIAVELRPRGERLGIRRLEPEPLEAAVELALRDRPRPVDVGLVEHAANPRVEIVDIAPRARCAT